MRLVSLKTTLLDQNFTLIPFLGSLEVRNQLKKHYKPHRKTVELAYGDQRLACKNVLKNLGENSLSKHIAHAVSACENHSYMFISRNSTLFHDDIFYTACIFSTHWEEKITLRKSRYLADWDDQR